MKREEAIALLREITSENAIIPNWVSLVNAKSGKYELHVEPEDIHLASLKPIIERHNLQMKKVSRLLVFYRET